MLTKEGLFLAEIHEMNVDRELFWVWQSEAGSVGLSKYILRFIRDRLWFFTTILLKGQGSGAEDDLTVSKHQADATMVLTSSKVFKDIATIDQYKKSIIIAYYSENLNVNVETYNRFTEVGTSIYLFSLSADYMKVQKIWREYKI